MAPTFSMPSLVSPSGLGELGAAVAVVEQVADAEVTEAIELRADLPELSADDLVVIDRLVLARAS